MFSIVQHIDAQTQENTCTSQEVATRVDGLEQSGASTSHHIQDIRYFYYRH